MAATKIPRDKIFLTTKIWLSNYGYEATAKSVEASLTKLQTDYLDLVLLHQPYGDIFGSFKALADLQKAGKIRAIGVSNFNSERLADIVAFQDAPVQVNQIEINPFYQREQDLMNAKARGHVLLEAWAPFAEGKDGIFSNKTLTTIGKNTASLRHKSSYAGTLNAASSVLQNLSNLSAWLKTLTFLILL